MKKTSLNERPPLSDANRSQTHSSISSHTHSLKERLSHRQLALFQVSEVGSERYEIQKLKNAKRYEQALDKLMLIPVSNDNFVNINELKAQVLFELKKYEQALKCFQELAQYALKQRGEEDENGESRFDFCPRKISSYFCSKGVCLEKLERYQEAIDQYKFGISKSKSLRQNYVRLAFCYKKTGKFEKTIKIFEKLIKNEPLYFENYVIAIKACKEQKLFQIAHQFMSSASMIEQFSKNRDQKEELLELNIQILKNNEKYDQIIKIYDQLIRQLIADPSNNYFEKLSNLYLMRGTYFDKINKITDALLDYRAAIENNKANITAINNCANASIRIGKFDEALQILNKGIDICSKVDGIFKRLMLKCQRFIVFLHMSDEENAQKELNEIIHFLQEERYIEIDDENQWKSLKFIKSVFKRYEKSLENIKIIENNISKKQSNPQFQQKITSIKHELYQSIEKQLSQQNKEKVNSQELINQINKLMVQVENIKTGQLAQQIEKNKNIFQKLMEIESNAMKSNDNFQKLCQEFSQLRLNQQQICTKIEDQYKYMHSNGALPMKLDKLEKEGKLEAAIYGKYMYWIIHAFLSSIRIVRTGMVGMGSANQFGVSKISQFFRKFKSVFKLLSGLPQIGTYCKAITSIIELFLQIQTQEIIKILDVLIMNNYLSEDELSKNINESIILIIESEYISTKILQKSQLTQSIASISQKMQKWFARKKSKIISQITSLQSADNESKWSEIRGWVMEDISSMFVFLIKDRNQKIRLNKNSDKNNNIILEAFNEVLIQKKSEEQLKELYKRESEIAANNEGKNCSVCSIY